MKRHIYQSLYKRERGQAIILVAAGLVGLVAMVGLVVDTGILFIEYGKLKRGVDAASIAAAQQYRSASGGVLDEDALVNAARNFIQLNQSDAVGIVVHSCESAVVADRPDQCNLDPLQPEKNRKLVEVVASKQVNFAFLRVIGINSTTISVTSVGEAAALDMVLIMDTSGSMAYETDPLGDPLAMNPLEDPSVCNYRPPAPPPAIPCEPMETVKQVALDFIDTIYFPYDRVAVVPMTSQSVGGDRYVEDAEITPLTAVKTDVVDAINALTVFEPRECLEPYDTDHTPGDCLKYNMVSPGPPVVRTFNKITCPIYDNAPILADADPSSCNSSNVGGTLLNAAAQLSDPLLSRPESFWVVVAILGGPANATDLPDPPDANWPNGYCPESTWLQPNPPTYFQPWCRDRYPSQPQHARSDTTTYINPEDATVNPVSAIFDADDFARESANTLAASVSGSGVTIYTIGLGAQIQSTNTVAAGEPAPGETLLKYIAECAGENDPDDCVTPVLLPQIRHGQYFYAPTTSALTDIFELIANNIATRISE